MKMERKIEDLPQRIAQLSWQLLKAFVFLCITAMSQGVALGQAPPATLTGSFTATRNVSRLTPGGWEGSSTFTSKLKLQLQSIIGLDAFYKVEFESWTSNGVFNLAPPNCGTVVRMEDGSLEQGSPTANGFANLNIATRKLTLELTIPVKLKIISTPPCFMAGMSSGHTSFTYTASAIEDKNGNFDLTGSYLDGFFGESLNVVSTRGILSSTPQNQPRPAMAPDYGSVKIGVSKMVSTGASCPVPSGGSCLTIAAVNIQGGNASEFIKTNDACSGVTLPGQLSCSVDVTFIPKKPLGPKTASLAFLGTAGEVFFTIPLIGAAEKGCEVSDLTPITDKEAKPFEDAAPGTPLFSLYFPSVGLDLDIAITDFLDDLRRLYGLKPSRISGYRPFEYQRHFRELRDKLEAIKSEIRKDPDQNEACRELKEKIDYEIDVKHQIPRCKNCLPPVNLPTVSSHTIVPALAVDVGGVKNVLPRLIDELAAANGLFRPYGLDDAVHFELAGTPSIENVRGMVESPVNILITDPRGRKVGFDPEKNSVVNQVGSSAYYSGSDTEPQGIEIGGAIPGSYLLTGIGTGAGPYTLSLERVGEEGQILERKVISGTVSLGQELRLSIRVSATVRIDIHPGEIPNKINPKSIGVIPLAILSSELFDATKQVNRSSLTFGKTGVEQYLSRQPIEEDVNGDGRLDLVCYFNTQGTGFQDGDEKGILEGELTDNTPIRGVDWVEIVLPTTICLRDDRTGDSLRFDTSTGAYTFIHCGTDSFILTGKGIIERAGCDIKLKSDLVDATYTACPIGSVKSGESSIRRTPLGPTFLIKDKNTLESNCSCQK